MPYNKLTIFVLVPLILAALPAHAYIGPGVGAGTIAVVLGILTSIVMAFFAILWYPVKRMIKKRKSARQVAKEQDHETQGSSDDS